MVGFAREGALHEEIAELDPRAERTAKQQHSIAASNPSENCNFVSDLAPSINNADTQERGTRFSGNAVNHLVKRCVHAIFLDNCGADAGGRVLS